MPDADPSVHLILVPSDRRALARVHRGYAVITVPVHSIHAARLAKSHLWDAVQCTQLICRASDMP